MKTSAIFALVLVGTLPLAPLRAQVAARHLEEAPRDDHHFKSPMQLDVPLLVADKGFWDGSEVRGEDLSTFVCDGVSIASFGQTATRGHDDLVTVTFVVTLHAERGIDKRVDLTIDAVRGESRLGEVAEGRIKLGEKKSVVREMVMKIPAKELSAEPRPVARVTVVVRDDP